MKPKELLFSLDHVGEDLLAGAEQTVLVRKHRPWAGAAAAAVVLVALGVGGFFLWKNLRGGLNPAATGEPGGTTAVHVPTNEPDPPSTEPDRLAVGDCWTGLSRARFDNQSLSLYGSLAADYEGLTSLPVYEREASRRYSETELAQRLFKTANWIGAAASDFLIPEYEGTEDGMTSLLSSYSAVTDQGTLTVYADGRIQMLYNEEYIIHCSVTVSPREGSSAADVDRAYRDTCMEFCGKELAERLGLGECGFVTCDRWDLTSSAWTVFTIYPLREDPADRLISRWFDRVQMLTNDGKTLRGFVLDRLPGETEAPEGLRLAGTYPIRSEAEAVEALLKGSGLCEETLILNELDDYSPTATLVYLPEAGHALLMPFYRFWVPANSEADCDEYNAVYVPAITDACLADWPAGQTARWTALEPDEEERVRALFDPEDPETIWYRQALACQYRRLGELDLAALFRAGIPGVDNTLSQAEREALTALGADLTGLCRRLPGKEVDAVLERVFVTNRETLTASALFSQFGQQVSADEVLIDVGSPGYQQAREAALAGLFGDSVYYVPELDCYYDFNQSQNTGPVTILALRRDPEGRILVTYDASQMPNGRTEAIWTVGLWKDEDVYRVRFNLPGKWAVPETYGELTEGTEGCFERIAGPDRDYFTDGTREIWLENGAVWIKDLSTGEAKSLLELKQAEGTETELVGVTAQRLYFGWNYADDWWGQNVYSINYRGQELRDLGTGLGVTFRDGWLILDSFRTDVSPVSLRIIDRNDRTVVDVVECWSWAEGNGSCWYIYPPALQDTEALDAMSQAERTALLEKLRYDLCRLDPDGTVTVVGSVERDYYGAYFEIDLERRCVRCYLGDEDGELLDLYTLLPVREAPVPDDPEPTDTTEAPDGYQPMLLQLENGRVGVAGPAGTVEALNYIGIPDQEPVWADLDGDGFRELVYWCNGPTSGLFTVGLCVYGLEEGWPVLEASQIYNISYGNVSLEQAGETVWFCRTPVEGPGYAKEALRLAVTLENGTLVLNGGSLPEGIDKWGGPEEGWFGASFDGLKAEFKDRCVLNHWAALVWVDPTDLIEGASKPVYAAVTSNSKTVTGLLHYVLQQDGSWLCARKGIEPIDAPADPDSLLGLTPDQVTERLGPCHFDMGSGLYIPCWFTKDCRMLTVHIQGVVEMVELKPLTALGD